jgi:hypothetical protein
MMNPNNLTQVLEVLEIKQLDMLCREEKHVKLTNEMKIRTLLEGLNLQFREYS